jgi:hypothetical protein
MAASSDRIILCASDEFSENLNRLPFGFAHNLAGSQLFELSRLVDLAEKVAKRSAPHLPGGDVYFNDGPIEPGEKPLRPDMPRMAAADLIRDTANCWKTAFATFLNSPDVSFSGKSNGSRRFSSLPRPIA